VGQSLQERKIALSRLILMSCLSRHVGRPLSSVGN
jgi:hypothetical protein